MATTFIPTATERASLEFSFWQSAPFWARYALSFALIAFGTVIYFRSPWAIWLGLVLLGHLPLWVKKQRLAPGGATPDHENVWAPVDRDWLERVEALEERGAAWDISPWDASSRAGCMVAVIVLLGLYLIIQVVVPSQRLVLYALALFGPIWLNGRRNNWHASELRLKGRALEVARRFADPETWEVVPLLALREGSQGQYPVDARLMLRPSESTKEKLIGIQVQVALNNVRGRRYPYLYAVVLAEQGFTFDGLPRQKGYVLEQESKEGVSYVVVRQYADNRGGWHTPDATVEKIMRLASQVVDRCFP